MLFILKLEILNILPIETGTPRRTAHHSAYNSDINAELSYVELWKMSCMMHNKAVGR